MVKSTFLQCLLKLKNYTLNVCHLINLVVKHLTIVITAVWWAVVKRLPGYPH